MTGDLAVEAIDLVKDFGATRAVDGVSLAVPGTSGRSKPLPRSDTCPRSAACIRR